MTEWLESKLFRGWFWKKIGNNLLEWLSDAPVILKAVVGITAGLFGWLYLVGQLSQPKPIIRGTGVALQLFGFILAAYGLERTLAKFGQVPSTSRIVPWLAEFSNIFDTAVKMRASSVVHPVAGSAKISVREKEGEPSKLERPALSVRLDFLEWEVAELERELKDEIEDVRHHIDDEVERLENQIEEEIEAVEDEVEEVREKVKEVNVGEGALWMEWSGVSFFVYGVQLASFPSSFLPAHRVFIIPVLAGMLLGSLHWYAE
jgi:hypothetical protein